MEIDIRSNKLGLGQVLRAGWRMYRANFTDILLITLCVYIPLNLFLAMPMYVNRYSGVIGWINRKLLESYLVESSFSFPDIVEWLIQTMATLGIIKIVANAIQGKTIPWTDAIKHAFSKWGKAFDALLLSALITWAPTLLLGWLLQFVTGLAEFIRELLILSVLLLIIYIVSAIRSVIYTLYYMFSVYAIALRDKKGKAALDHSKALVEGQWWRLAWIQGVIVFIVGLPGMVTTSDNIALGAGLNMVGGIVKAFSAVTFTILFLNNEVFCEQRPATEAPSPSSELDFFFDLDE